jgi:hypothetical protein
MRHWQNVAMILGCVKRTAAAVPKVCFFRFTGIWPVTRVAVCTASSGYHKPSTVTRTTYGNISLLVYRRNNYHLLQKLILFSVLTGNIRSKCLIFFHHSNKVGYDVLVNLPHYQLWTRRWDQQSAWETRPATHHLFRVVRGFFATRVDLHLTRSYCSDRLCVHRGETTLRH